jgi:hypothetical protein
LVLFCFYSVLDLHFSNKPLCTEHWHLLLLSCPAGCQILLIHTPVTILLRCAFYQRMATEVASILVPRADDAGGQQHTPTAAHAALKCPTPLSPMLSPKLPKPTDPADLAAAIRKQVRS